MTLQDATDEETSAPPPTGEPTRPSAPRGLKLAVVALALLSVGLGVLAAALSAQNRDTEDRTADVRRTAGAIGTAMLTYDYRHLDAYEKRVKALATAKFAEEFDREFPAYAELYKLTKGSSKVRDLRIYVEDGDGDDAAAMVQVDYVVSGVSGQNRPLTVFFEVLLVHTVDGWRVANLKTVQSNERPNPTSTSTVGN